MCKGCVDILAIDHVCDNISDGNLWTTFSQANKADSVNSVGVHFHSQQCCVYPDATCGKTHHLSFFLLLLLFSSSRACASNSSMGVDTRYQHYLNAFRTALLFWVHIYLELESDICICCCTVQSGLRASLSEKNTRFLPCSFQGFFAAYHGPPKRLLSRENLVS